MEEWKEYRLGDVISIAGGFAYKGDLIGKGDNYLLGMGCVSFNDNFLDKGARQYDGDCPERYYAEPGDIVLATRQQSDNLPILGMPAVIPSKYKGRRMIVGANLYRVVINDKDFNNRYLFWLLKTPAYVDHIRSCQSGTTVRMITKSNIEDFVFRAPNKTERCRIADFLWTLNDKIEINKRINDNLPYILLWMTLVILWLLKLKNDNLEAQAQALFRSWFVDFEPFQDQSFVDSEIGMIPYGWKVATLDDVLELKRQSIRRGFDNSLPYLPIDTIPMKSLGIDGFKPNDEAQSSLQLFEKDEIIIGAMRVYFHRVVIAPQRGITRNTCFVLEPKLQNSLSFCALLCNTDEVIDHANRTSKGSTMPYAVWEGGLNSFKFALPPTDIIYKFDSITKQMLRIIRDGFYERVRLAKLRDTLLPLLMSGELKLNDLTM